ncbi:MAG: hypothetical protein V1816_03670 [Pseudomonadota bacterium]
MRLFHFFKKAVPFLPAVALLLSGVGAFALILFSGLNDLVQDAVLAPMPGEVEFEPPGPGKYSIFLETSRELGPGDRETMIPRLKIRLEDSRGRTVPLQTAGFGGTYDYPGRHGLFLMGFQIREGGRYRLRVLRSGDAPVMPASLVVIKGFMERLVKTILISSAVFMGALAAAGAALFFVLVRPKRDPGR